MIIACPRCGAAYAVDGAVFGARDRVVQCCECAYRWSQAPQAETEVASGDNSAPSVQQSGLGDSSEMFGPPEQDASEKPSADTPSPPEQVKNDAGSSEPEPSGVEDGGGEKDDAIPPTARLLERSGGEEPSGNVSPDQPATPSPGRGGRALTAASAATATILSLAALLILLRGPIVSAVPEAVGVYGLLGLATDSLGRGLEIREVASARDRVDGREVLTVTGVVANITRSREPLPTLRVTLYDDADEEVQSVTVAQARTSLDPGESLRFEAKIPAPQPDARLLRVGFTAPPPDPVSNAPSR